MNRNRKIYGKYKRDCVFLFHLFSFLFLVFVVALCTVHSSLVVLGSLFVIPFVIWHHHCIDGLMFNQILTSYSLPLSLSVSLILHCLYQYATTPIYVSSAHSSKVIMECRILQQYLLFVTPVLNDACLLSMKKIVPNGKRIFSIVISFYLPFVIIVGAFMFIPLLFYAKCKNNEKL